MVGEQMAETVGHAAKKRKGGDECADHKPGSAGLLRLPEIVATLAAEGTVLRYSDDEGLYIVNDGPGFERRFNELRCTRGKKVESAATRPFSRMHTHFVLIRGEKWAGTGSAFRFKHTDAPSASGPVSAAMVDIELRDGHDDRPYTVSLQHFLDVTGAGALFKEARQFRQEQSAGSSYRSSPVESSSTSSGVSSGTHSPPSSNEQQQITLQPGSALPPQQPLSNEGVLIREDSLSAGIMRYLSSNDIENSMLSPGHDMPLGSQEVSSLLGTMWDCDSKGDQAYFFMRKSGMGPFPNGAIVRIRGGVVVPDDDFVDSDPGLLMVVSDRNAKWKGDPHPTPEQEALGHWCCFLGQVPVTVEGVVKCGDFIGPKSDGSGLGIVCKLGTSPVIGVALVDKEEAAGAVIKTMCFAGLNAINHDHCTDFNTCFQHMQEMAARVEGLQSQVKAVTEQVDSTGTDVQNLRSRLEHGLRWLNHRILSLESTPVAVAVEVPLSNTGAPRLQHELPGLPTGDGHWRHATHMHRVPPAQVVWSVSTLHSCVHAWVRTHRRLALLMVGMLLLVCVVPASLKKHKPPRKSHPKMGNLKGGKGGQPAKPGDVKLDLPLQAPP